MSPSGDSHVALGREGPRAGGGEAYPGKITLEVGCADEREKEQRLEKSEVVRSWFYSASRRTWYDCLLSRRT